MNYLVFTGRLLVLALLAALIFLSFHLLQPRFISVGLDASWVAALAEARHLNLRFGEDVIFTIGPLASVYENSFARPLFYENLSVFLLFTFFLITYFGVASVRARSVLAPCIAVVPILFSLHHDSVFMSLPVCACLIGTLPDFRPYNRFLVVAGALASAAATLAKFSIFPVAIVAFLLLDIFAVLRKRIPIGLAAYAASLVALLWWTSPGASLWEFIKHSMDIAIGYTDAMSSTGTPLEVVLVYVTMIAVMSLIGATEFKGLRTGEVSSDVTVSRVLIFAIFLFMCAKAGLVRHDGHAVIAWSGVALGAGLYCVFAWGVLTRREVGVLVLIMTVGAGGVYRWHGQKNGLAPGAWIVGQLNERYRELSLWPRFLAAPNRWLTDQEKLQQAALARVRAEQPLLMLAGTVDAIPSIQSSVIANGLRYWPRPIIQEYSTYSRPLIEVNRAFFRSHRAPDYLLMAPGSIDGRYPALAEGPLWPDFLALYSVQDISNGLSILHRRDKPVDVPLRVIETKVAGLGEPVAVDAGRGAVFATIDVRPTLAGAIAALLFKSSQINIDVQYVDGGHAEYRLIPGIAREGFFLSPTVETAEDYLALATGATDLNTRKVNSFIITTRTLGQWLWRSQFTVTLSRLDDDALRRSTNRISLPPDYENRIHLAAILNKNQPAGPALRMVPEGLLAHAPKTLKVATGGRTQLDIAFGIQAGAWQGEGDTHGVCFSVVSKSAPAPLWERCLDPKRQAADRGQQIATITVPQSVEELLLETACRDGCNWDWSYWGRIAFQ
jgi:hypothetical protein